ncbi:hypothetical protein [Bacillus pseudomycoides]|nr:hypothetical protein [Bacillus pseudomycoides]
MLGLPKLGSALGLKETSVIRVFVNVAPPLVETAKKTSRRVEDTRFV